MQTNSQLLSARILIIGDVSAECHPIPRILAHGGHAVSVTEWTSEMLESIEPDLIILIDSPHHPGQDALIQQVRRQTAFFIPILLVTSEGPSRLLHNLGVAANDFLEMPVEPDHLLTRVQVMLQWKQLMDELIQLNHQREHWIAYLVHDLRTPLSATNQVLRQVLQGVFGRTLLELEEALVPIVENNQVLIQMVETLLNSYQYESGQQSCPYLPVNLTELSRQVVHELLPLAQQKGLSLMLTTSQELEHSEFVVWGDRLELYRLLINLVGNAIQHTESGSIEMRLSFSASSDLSGNAPVIIEIEDTGVGIPPAELATIFERFQSGRSRRRGYGLGLYLSHQIVKAHQGTITVRSELGRGSVFTICLPAHTDYSLPTEH